MAEKIPLAILEKISGVLGDQIWCQVMYLFNYKSNIKNLIDGVEDLHKKRASVKPWVDAAKNNLEGIAPIVEAWLINSDEIERKANEVFEGIDRVENGCFYGWCPNLKYRCMLSRKAVKLTVDVTKLQEEGKGYTQVLVFPEPQTGAAASKSTIVSEVFKSRISKMKEVVKALKADHIQRIGICGLPGVGKTRMVKEIRKQAKVENLFDEIAMAVVSQNQNVMKIQDQLATTLDLKLDEKSTTFERGERLCRRLTQGSRILIILDDIWKELDLGELGIPIGGGGQCKVLLTSRNEHVLRNISSQMVITIQVLSDEEAWDLFKENAGDRVESTELKSVATKVVNECGGLPLAIVTLGKALNGREEYAWEDALAQLQRSAVTNIEGMKAKVYSILQLSYDFLEGNEIKRFFLLCCLFPEDYDIPTEDLVRYAVGLRLFELFQDLAGARSTVKTLVDQLKSWFLLLASEKEGHVKMHDVVRDFGLGVASNGEQVYMVCHDVGLQEWPQTDKNEAYTAISLWSDEKLELPIGLNYPRVKLLQLCSKGSVKFSEDYFGRMKELGVVAFAGQFIAFDSEHTTLVESPPAEAVQFFMNVRALCLEHCHFGSSSDMSSIWRLQKLEILSLYCSDIKVLPREIQKLGNLKLLDLRNTPLDLIPSGVLSCLTKLEELYMGNYFQGREVENRNQGDCASITELYSLSGLKSLQISLSDPELWLKFKDFGFDKLRRFAISLCPGYPFYDYQFPNSLILEDLDLAVLLDTKMNALMNRIEELRVEAVTGIEIFEGYFPARLLGRLRNVTLRHLPDLRLLWCRPVQPSCLGNLRVIKVKHCDAIKSLFSPSVVDCLVQLQKLSIGSCSMLEEIVSEDDKCATKMIVFPKLDTLKLEDLPLLKSFVTVSNFTGSENDQDGAAQPIVNEVILPSLENLLVRDMHHVVEIVSSQMQAGSSYKLRDLYIEDCKQLLHVAKSDQIKLLGNLEQVSVTACPSLETVFDFKGPEVSGEHAEVMLGQLKAMTLRFLPELSDIWKIVPNIGIQAFQSLTTLGVYLCDKLKYIFSAFMAKALVNLQIIDISFCETIEVVIQTGEEEEYSGEIETVYKFEFPQLRVLKLYSLTNLKTFCYGSHDIHFPSLDEVAIWDCPKMKNFCSGSLSAPKLKRVKAGYNEEYCDLMGDLNSTIRHSINRSPALSEIEEESST